MNKTKSELLEHYARATPHRFCQFDCFLNVGEGDDIVKPDKDGDSLFNGETYELMSGQVAVRVLITPETAKEDALRALEKIRDWIDRDGFKSIRDLESSPSMATIRTSPF